MGRASILLAGSIAACGFDSSGGGAATDGGASTGGTADTSATGVGSEATTATTAMTSDGEGSSSSAATSMATTTTMSTTMTTSESATETGADTGVESSSEGGSSSTGDIPVAPWCDAAEPTLAACYAFADLAGGVLLDESANGNDGTVAGVAIEAGPLGDAAVFSAASEVSVPAHPATDFTTAATLELFVRIDALPGAGRVGVLDRDGQWSLFIYADGGMRCGGSEFAFWDAPTTGAWMHVGCVVGDGFARIYANGAMVAELATGAPMATGNGNPLAIGDNSPGFDQPLEGAIGGVRLWSAVRTPEQLCAGAGALCPG